MNYELKLNKMKEEVLVLPKMLKVYEAGIELTFEGILESKFFFSKEKAEKYAEQLMEEQELELREVEEGEEPYSEKEVQYYLRNYYVSVSEHEVHS
jgi:hypothetical protein